MTGGADTDDGWTRSAASWIASLDGGGDYGRRFVLDTPMLARVGQAMPARALDVGCGEGRFCRMIRERFGVRTVGLDPTPALLDQARARDPDGDYVLGRAEALPFDDAGFDLVVSYLSLIDIPDMGAGIAEMARVLRPGGRLLIANLTSFNTAAMGLGWTTTADGARRFCFDHYLEERVAWAEWRGIRVRNRHRPLQTYMGLLLGAGLTLTHFAEPAPEGGDPVRAERYRRAPWFMIMEWRRPPV